MQRLLLCSPPSSLKFEVYFSLRNSLSTAHGNRPTKVKPLTHGFQSLKNDLVFNFQTTNQISRNDFWILQAGAKITWISEAQDSPEQEHFPAPFPAPLPKALTTRVRKQSVPAGARGSKAATRSHTLIFLVVKKQRNTMALLKRKDEVLTEKKKKQLVQPSWYSSSRKATEIFLLLKCGSCSSPL